MTPFQLLRESRKTQLSEDYEKYKLFRNKLTHLKTKAKDKYYRDKSELYGRDISKIWQLVNEVTNYKIKNKTTIQSMVDKDGKKLSDPIAIANCLNNHFSSVGNIMAQELNNIDCNRLKNLTCPAPEYKYGSAYIWLM